MLRNLLFYMLMPFSALPAQQLRICYQNHFDSLNQQNTLDVFLSSLSPDSLALRAVNFSFAYHDSCASFDSLQSTFRGVWGSFLEQTRIDSLAISHQGTAFNRRLKHGNADAGFPVKKPVWVPGQGDSLRVLRLFFRSQCASFVYMENELEHPANQLGDTLFFSIDYLVENCIPPDTTKRDTMSMGLHASAASHIYLYPNPAHEQLIIRFSPSISGEPKLCLLTLTGVPITPQAPATKLRKGAHAISLKGLPSGMYLLRYETQEVTGYLRWVKIP